MLNLYAVNDTSTDQFSHGPLTDLLIESIPLNLILGLGLSSENKIANEMALNIFGQLSLGSNEVTIKFSKTLETPHGLIMDNFITPYIKIVGD